MKEHVYYVCVYVIRTEHMGGSVGGQVVNLKTYRNHLSFAKCPCLPYPLTSVAFSTPD